MLNPALCKEIVQHRNRMQSLTSLLWTSRKCHHNGELWCRKISKRMTIQDLSADIDYLLQTHLVPFTESNELHTCWNVIVNTRAVPKKNSSINLTNSPPWYVSLVDDKHLAECVYDRQFVAEFFWFKCIPRKKIHNKGLPSVTDELKKKNFERSHWAQIELEEVQTRAGNLNAIKLFQFYAVKMSLRCICVLEHTKYRGIVINSNQIESWVAVKKLNLKKNDSIVRRRLSEACSVIQQCDPEYWIVRLLKWVILYLLSKLI
jgi:hypothetical protein